MARDKKFKIAGLKSKESFSDAAKLILKHKLKIIFNEISGYQENNSPENLHSLRIALRRFRYNLEIFYSCIKPKLFNRVYDYVQNTQDIIGELRDLDVLIEKIRNLENEIGINVPESFVENISKERSRLRTIIQMELTAFKINEDLKKLLIK